MTTPSTAAPAASADIKDGTRPAVVWPDPSPLSSWWQEVMDLPGN